MEKKSPAKIQFICNYYGQGGAQKNAARLARIFSSRGFDTEIIFLKRREKIVNFEGDPKCIVIEHANDGILSKFKAIIRAFKLVRNSNADVTFGFFPASNVLCALASRKGTKVIATLRNPVNIPDLDGKKTKRSQSFIFGFLDKLIGTLGGYHKIIAVSDDVKKSCADYPRSYRNRIQTIYNAVDQLKTDESKIDLFKHQYGLNDGRVWLGFLGRMHSQKNPDFLLEVISKINDKNICLVYAGDGASLNNIKDKARSMNLDDRVKFIGMIDKDDVPSYLKSISIMLFPSIYEGFGLTQVEAMSVGCPIITSDIEVMKEIGGGLTVNLPLEPELWASNIKSLIGSDEKLTQLQLSGLTRYVSFCDENLMADKYLVACDMPVSR